MEPNPEQQKLMQDVLEPFTLSLENLLSQSNTVVIAIDGRAASGKTTLARQLAKDYGGRLVHMDDFYLPQELRTEKRLAEPGGNLHYERFITDVLPGLRNLGGSSYQIFDCSQMQMGECRNLAPGRFTIVEGAYALHPKLGRYYDLSLFLSCPNETQVDRVEARNPLKLEQFMERWIPLEETYFNAFGVEETVDFFIQT
ncbi:MAG TPA: hypothetical protein VLR89_03490 [Anaerolineaceae bacterium]|nr:hypothetical protein [Anaerolineaceae bacterium]